MKKISSLMMVILLMTIGLTAQNLKKNKGIPNKTSELAQVTPLHSVASLSEINENFEGYADFILSFSPWTTTDVDQSETYGIEGYTFPNLYSPMAFMIFNPSATSPAITDPAIQPHSGSKFAACCASTTPPNNDWLISPAITLGTNSSVSFWVKSFNDTYGLERYKVGISTTNTNPASFTVISGLNYLEAPATAWEQKTFDLNTYNGQTVYIGIQCVSNDAFVFMVDDFLANTTISQTSSLSGLVTDAFNGQPIPQASVTIGSLSTTTDANGNYLIENVAAGTINAAFSSNVTNGSAPLNVSFYDQSSDGANSVSCSKAGYITYVNNQVVIPPGENLNLNISLSPTLTDAELRFVLNWGQLPNDLDSHLDTPSIEGQVYHVYYNDQGSASAAPYSALDYDVTSGYGPETMTIYQIFDGTYKYYIYDYSGSSTPLTASQAVVQIYNQNGLLQTIQVPTTGTGRYWYVCDVNGATGALSLHNNIQESSPGIGKSADKPKSTSPGKSVTSWLWNFGDGTTSTQQNPSHTYNTAGTYTVSLTVGNGTSTDTETKTAYIIVTGGSTGSGTLTGMVTDAINGNPIEGALVSVAGLSAITDVSGNYTINNIPSGLLTANFSVSQTTGIVPMLVNFYDQSTENSNTVECTKSGYSAYSNNQVIIPQGGSLSLNISLSPALNAGQLRFVLNWSSSPSDLDSHLNTPSIEGSEYHVYFSEQGNASAAPYAQLDYDVTTGFGPETMTIYQKFTGIYQYYVHNYSETPEITTSQAVVQIYNDAGLIQTLQVPTTGTGYYWYVCDINGNNGQITIRNTIQETAPGNFKSILPAKPIQKENRRPKNIVSWLWNFGDGSTSTQQNPSHSYVVAGTYTVSLTVNDGTTADSETKINLISAGYTGTEEITSNQIKLYPVPASDVLQIESETMPDKLLVTDMSGKVLISQKGTSRKTILDLSVLKQGTYLLTVLTSEGKIIKRFSVK